MKKEPYNPETTKAAFYYGVREALQLPALVLFAGMTGFGSLALESGLTLAVAIASSIGIWGLPGQVAMAELYAVGVPAFAIILAVSMANMRFLPMTLPMVPLLRGNPTGWKWRYLIIHFMSINTWAAALRQGPLLKPALLTPYYLGFSFICITSGALGTVTGFLLAGILPFYITVALVFLNPAYFAFLFSGIRQRNCIFAMGIGAILGPLLYIVTPEWGLPVCGILAGLLGYYLDKVIGGPDGKA